MLPSTRTPEGDPLKCLICGGEHLVLTSCPPGDSVCPSCGSHSWMPKPEQQEVIAPSQIPHQVRTLVRTLVDQLRLSSTRTELGNHLVIGLVKCLAANGAMLWIYREQGSDGQRAMELCAFNGLAKGCEFAEEVSTTNQESMRIEVIQSVERLLIGVPLRTRNGVTGVIEVVQRATHNSDARTGYLRFILSMVAVVESCRALGND